jgi:MerR family transcriptional regulator, copper efflux regulator
MTQRLKIGEVAKTSGLPVKTIRYYEEIGLLSPAVERSEGHYRLFDASVLNRLAFIRRSQTLGLNLKEIQQILALHDHGELPCDQAKQHLEAKVTEISRQIDTLITLRAELQGILSGWQERPAPDRLQQTICPNIQSTVQP